MVLYHLSSFSSHVLEIAVIFVFFVLEPFAAKRLLAQLVKKLEISVLTTDRSTLMKSMMRYCFIYIWYRYYLCGLYVL
jgi:hypothetical protein